MRRWLFLGVLALAMLPGQGVLAASLGPHTSMVNLDAVLVGVITIAVFLWIYSMIA